MIPLCLYLLLIVTLGYALFSLIRSGPITLSHWLGVVPTLGAGSLGLLLFWFSLAGFAPSRGILAIIAAAVMIGIFLLAKRKRLAPLNAPLLPKHIGGKHIFLWAIIVFVLAVVSAASLSGPIQKWDAFAIWGFKAKVLVREALQPLPAYFHDFNLSYSHLDYPLLVPFLTAGAYAAMGVVDDQWGKIISVLLDFAVVPLVYFGLRWKLARLPASCLCALLVLLPTFLQFGGAGYADLPVATFYAGSIVFVVRWIELQKLEDLIFATLFSSFLAFTKSEGLVLALINGLVLSLFALRKWEIRAWKGVVLFALGWLALEAAWLIFNHNLPKTHENYGPKLMSFYLIQHLPNLPHVTGLILARAFAISHWGGVWLMTFLLALLGWRGFLRPHIQAMWLLLGLHLLAYALVFCVTSLDLNLLLDTTVNRLLWHAVPAAVLLAGWHWAEIETPAPMPAPAEMEA